MNWKKYKVLTVMAAAVLSFSSCVMYHPHNCDIPLLEKRGDLRIDASGNMTFPLLDGTGANASVSWAPLDMVGVQAYGSFTLDNNYYVQAAAGTFKGWGKSVLEFYAGAGTGHSNYEYRSQNSGNKESHIGGRYSKLFGQVNFGWNHLANDVIDVGVGLKAGVLNPNWSKESYDETTMAWTTDFTHNEPHFLFEPQLMFRVGGEHVKFSLNISYAAIGDWPTDNNNLNYTRLSIGAGINYKF